MIRKVRSTAGQGSTQPDFFLFVFNFGEVMVKE